MTHWANTPWWPTPTPEERRDLGPGLVGVWGNVTVYDPNLEDPVDVVPVNFSDLKPGCSIQPGADGAWTGWKVVWPNDRIGIVAVWGADCFAAYGESDGPTSHAHLGDFLDFMAAALAIRDAG